MPTRSATSPSSLRSQTRNDGRANRLSTIRHDLHTSLDGAQWILSGYLLALALMLPLNGWLVGRMGAKRLYIWCFLAFTLASLLCGMVTSLNTLVVARIFQGAAGGLLAPMTQLMLARVAGRHLARVMGLAAVPILIAPILGPVVAGAILTYAQWCWLFYINLPIGILAVACAYYALPVDERIAHKRPLDGFGFLLISPGLACLLSGFEHTSSGDGVVALLVGVALTTGFVAHARRTGSAALIDLSVFRIAIFSTAAVPQFLSFGVIYAGHMLVPLYLITGCGFTTAQAGWILAPMGLGMLCVYPLMGVLTDRFGCRRVCVTGTLLNTMGTLPFLWMINGQVSFGLVAACMFVRGAGQGAIGIPSLSAACAAIPKQLLPLATTAVNIVQRLGGPIATTAMAMVISLAEHHTTAAGARLFLLPFAALIVLQVLVLLSAIRFPVRIHQELSLQPALSRLQPLENCSTLPMARSHVRRGRSESGAAP